MVTVTVMCGPSGCGKSTFAWGLLQNSDNTKYIATDDIRQELLGDAENQQHNKLVFDTAFKRIKEALSNGVDIIFDATNLSAKRRKSFVKMCKDAGAEQCICYAFNNSLENCVDNQTKRARKVPIAVIQRQCNNYEFPSKEEGWDRITEMEVYHG